MKKETTRLKCFGCHADFTVSAEDVHDTVRNASISGMRKLRCPLCGSFLYPKEFDVLLLLAKHPLEPALLPPVRRSDFLRAPWPNTVT